MGSGRSKAHSEYNEMHAAAHDHFMTIGCVTRVVTKTSAPFLFCHVYVDGGLRYDHAFESIDAIAPAAAIIDKYADKGFYHDWYDLPLYRRPAWGENWVTAVSRG